MADASESSRATRLPTHASVSEKTTAEIEHLSSRYGRLFNEIRADLDELRAKEVLSRAVKLSEKTGQHFNHNEQPQFFVGDLDASFVLVHLNPKQTKNCAEKFQGKVATFEEYFDAHRHFGARNYSAASGREHKSPFDRKQIAFLRPFDVIEFVEEHNNEDRLTNLKRVIDQKLQLELIPYGSDSFTSRGMTEEVLRPHLERVMNVITAHAREYVIFCGAVFEKLLGQFIVGEEQRFRLPTKDGSATKQDSRFATLRLPYSGGTVDAGLAPSWARQGINMPAYAEQVRTRYKRGQDALPSG